MNPITQRIADWRHERRIASLSRDTKWLESVGCGVTLASGGRLSYDHGAPYSPVAPVRTGPTPLGLGASLCRGSEPGNMKPTKAQILFNASIEATLDNRLCDSDKKVYAVLLRRSRNAWARPSRTRIAQEAGMVNTAVTRSIRKLESSGYVTTTRQKGNQTTIYGLPKLASGGSTRDTSGGSSHVAAKGVSAVLPNIKARAKSRHQEESLSTAAHRTHPHLALVQALPAVDSQ